MIRELRKDDLNTSFFKLLSQLGGSTKKYDVHDLWSKYLSGIARTFVFIHEDKIVGAASILMEEKMLKGGSSVGHIEDVVVDKTERSLGIGKALINRCVEAAKDFGCYKVILDCSEKNIPFYVKCGFGVHCYCMRLNTENS